MGRWIASGSQQSRSSISKLVRRRKIQPQLLLTLTVFLRLCHGSRASSGRMMGRQGVVEFDDYFAESDVCLASNLLADAAHWLATPDVRFAVAELSHSQ